MRAPKVQCLGHTTLVSIGGRWLLNPPGRRSNSVIVFSKKNKTFGSVTTKVDQHITSLIAFIFGVLANADKKIQCGFKSILTAVMC